MHYFSHLIKLASFCFCYLLLAGTCLAQSKPVKPKTIKEKTIKPPLVTTTEVDTAAVQKDTTASAKPLLDVLFATNEEGELFINEESKGIVSKQDFRYIKLEPGQYAYRVNAAATHDEVTDTFTVAEGRPNEVFIDLLFLIDEKTSEREFLKNKASIPDVLHISNDVRSTPLKEGGSVIKNRDAERAVIATLAANMVPVKGGKFIMGNNRSHAPDETEHVVTINNLLFGKYEVTQRQWEVIMGYNPCFNKTCATCPVDNVSWVEVTKFIRKLDLISNKRFRLPTEAEWEYVARMGGRREIDSAGSQEAFINKTAWNFTNANQQTHPVGTRKPNAAGIYDLTGNVSEWCLDWYSASYYQQEGGQINPAGAAQGKEKVIRGGNFKDFAGDRFRPSFRNKKSPLERAREIGFRLVMELRE